MQKSVVDGRLMFDEEYEDEADEKIGHCERCGKTDAPVAWIPLMGYSERMCRKCAASAYRNEEAV